MLWKIGVFWALSLYTGSGAEKAEVNARSVFFLYMRFQNSSCFKQLVKWIQTFVALDICITLFLFCMIQMGGAQS